MSDDHLLCYGISHLWEPQGFGWGVVDRSGVEHANHAYIRLECTRCGMKVERRTDPWFALTGSTYQPPEGYGVRGQGRGAARAEARAELVRRYAGPRLRKRTGRSR